MATHSYSLRSRLNSPATARSPSGTSPLTRSVSKSTRRVGGSQAQHAPVALQLSHVVGTTAANPSGLSCCAVNDSFAYCAGAVAVLAKVRPDGSISHRYYKARPGTASTTSTASYFDSPSTTPNKSRTSFFPRRRDTEDAATPIRDHTDDGGSKTWTARERTKAITCVSLSPDGKFLAVGETGYNPRILIFSTGEDDPCDVPLCVISEHTIGVRSVAFSPNSKFLATLGDVNDGFLHIWSVHPVSGNARIHATNKCTTNVCDMVWCGTSLVTAGTRHIKIWQINDTETSSPGKRSRLQTTPESAKALGTRILQGRNCLLGDLVEATFTCLTAVDNRFAIACADNGQFGRLDVSNKTVELEPLDTMPCLVNALSFDGSTRRIVWAGGGGKMCLEPVSSFFDTEKADKARRRTRSNSDRPGLPRKRSCLRESLGLNAQSRTNTIAVGCLKDRTVCIDAEANVRVEPFDHVQDQKGSHQVSGHCETIRGVRSLPASSIGEAAFFTWTRNGEVRFWTANAGLLQIKQLDLDEFADTENGFSNELKVLCHTERAGFVSGDRFGVMKLVNSESWQTEWTSRAHSAEITDICVHELSSLMASGSRDRMIQIFRVRDRGLDLLQTLDDHISAVTALVFNADGNKLLSCSTDRTIIVREKMEAERDSSTILAFLQTRIITLKAAPLSMCLLSGPAETLLVSTLDRRVAKIDMVTGNTIDAFKTSDLETDDSAALHGICHASVTSKTSRVSIVAGYSSTDKSVRIYDLDKHVLIEKAAAHTEGVSDMTLVPHDDGSEQCKLQLVSTGVDSTIMVWSVRPVSQLPTAPLGEPGQEQSLAGHDAESTAAKASPASLPPLRKILTKLDMADFGRLGSPRPRSREPSPTRLKRKTSKLSLATPAIEEADESSSSLRVDQFQTEVEKEGRPPSPKLLPVTLQKQRSTTDLNVERRSWTGRSPSPAVSTTFTLPTSTSLTALSTSKHQPQANNSRLRRPPSVPTDLRNHASLPVRRKSVSTAGELSSISMATDQTCRMLRTYRKRLKTSNELPDLDDLEEELEAALVLVRHKQSRAPQHTRRTTRNTKRGKDDNDAELVQMMGKAAIE